MILATERLLLRPWEDRDRTPLARIVGDPHVRRFYPAPATAEETEAQIDNAIAQSARHGFHFQAAELKATGALIGLIGIGVIPDDIRAALAGRPRVEIGWQLDQSVWGQGLAPEGARAWLAYGFDVLGLPEIVAFTAAVNTPSRRVMEKLGMTRTAADDFAHPRVAEGSHLRPHVLYHLNRQIGRQ